MCMSTEAAAPELSVVVPSVNGAAYLFECLAALDAVAANGVALEVLVVDRCGDLVREEIRRRHPDVRMLPVGRLTTIPAMRALAFRAARAPAIAVIEDHILVPAGWGRDLLDALAEGHQVVGGSIENAATARLVDRAAFLCEYSHLLGAETAVAGTLAGNNVVYRRCLLEQYAATVAEGRWEDRLHTVLLRDGVPLVYRPGIRVRHKMHYRLHEYLSQRFLYSRAYAGAKAIGMPVLARALTSIATLALPPVLLTRIVRRMAAARRHASELAAALPLLVLFVCAWAAGEAVGYAAGAGDALVRVR
jgi:hypothetical protein